MDIPPQITTAQLLLRGLIPSFLGCGIGDSDECSANAPVRASAFQMTFRKDLKALGVENGAFLWFVAGVLFIFIGGEFRCGAEKVEDSMSVRYR